MKKLLVPLFIALSATAFAFAGNASAAEGKAMTPQQQKFSDCAHKSKGMKGEARKQFMSECLKGGGAVTQSATHKVQAKAAKAEGEAASATDEQREKMKTCNSQAKDKQLRGKDRRSFMSQCLKN